MISGTVTSSGDGTPLPGVNVLVKGSTIGTSTDSDGKYTISASSNAILVFSFIGYASQEASANNQTVLNIVLVEDASQLGEVVVTALGLKKDEKALGYAVSTVSSSDITNAGATNFGSALYGKAAGVRINAANGGAASAVNIQIRGVSSVGLNTQPLYVVDGIPIRNHALINYENATNSTSFDNESRVRENGMLDINPEDIETLTVLKGASASALYGSDATNGVVVITTKKGTKKKGLGVDLKYQYDVERLAFQPKWQNSYGPGYDRASNVSITGNEEGWVTESDGSVHPNYRSYAQFGPKFDGRTVKYWDGSNRQYSAEPNNYKDFFDEGYNSNGSVAISGASDKGSFRIGYTRTDYKGIMPGFEMNKNYFNLNANLKLSDRVSVDVVSSYVNSLTHNRPTMMRTIFASYGGFFSRMDDMNLMREKYQTTKGYKYVLYNQAYDDNEKFAYNMRASNVMDYFWTQLKNSRDETQNRFLNSATVNVKLTEKLTFRGRFGNDYTNTQYETKEYASIPNAFGTSGSYGINNGSYNLVYGDLLLTYNQKLTSDLDMTLTGGYIGKKDIYHESQASTNGGLVTENFFNLLNSANSFTTSQISASTRKQAYMAGFGMAEFSYKNWLFLQGTGRYEASSTLPPKNNSYFYPSVNGSFLFSEVVTLPSFVDFAKLRSSWGMVGNHPGMYDASVNYSLGTVIASGGTAVYQQSNGQKYGNDNLKSEKKIETEFGLETKLFDNKIGVDFSFYQNKVVDQILQLSTPYSSGAASILSNVGTLRNRGFELALSITPVRTTDFRWDVRFNFGTNKNRLIKLMDGVDYLTINGSVAANQSVVIRAAEGQTLGDIYVHPIATNANGDKIVREDGVYDIDFNTYVKVGNVMPKAVGGLVNTFTYKNFSLNVVMDYKLGGNMISEGLQYYRAAGMLESTLQYRDAAHGGLSYNVDANGRGVQQAGGTYNDGVLLKGVTADGSANTNVISAAYYYTNTYNWGTYADAGGYNDYSKAVLKNNFIKMREVSLTYSLPKTIVSKLGFTNMQASLVGRNLFYVWKTLPDNWDPEAATGDNWQYQGIDQGTAAPTRSMGVILRASF
jgi:iron complex outermembrane receptor protein